jgi:hypothetical protein
MFDKNLIVGLVVLAVVVLGIYSYAPKLRKMMSGMEGFANGAAVAAMAAGGPNPYVNHALQDGTVLSSPQSGQLQPQMAGDANTQHAAAKKSGVSPFTDFAQYNNDESLAALPTAGAAKPQGCYPREQLNPAELLPKDQNSQWAQANPAGAGDIQGKNFLSAGALIGINTVGQSLRNSNLQLRAEPPNPQMPPGPWNFPTIQPDLQRRPLE